MNYPLRVTVKHTYRRKDDMKEEGDGGLLFSTAALRFVPVIPTKGTPQFRSLGSDRRQHEPNKPS